MPPAIRNEARLSAYDLAFKMQNGRRISDFRKNSQTKLEIMGIGDPKTDCTTGRPLLLTRRLIANGFSVVCPVLAADPAHAVGRA